MGLLSLALAVAGCANTEQIGSSVAGTTVAFESIDGLPRPLFGKLAQDLKEEAAARQIVVVNRAADAQFRIRSYLAAEPQSEATSFAWAWDIYDTELNRAYRLSGEERGAASGRSVWGAADDELLRHIARSGIEQLAAFMGSSRSRAASGPEGAPEPPRRSLWSIAGLDDFRPETAGIFRIFRPEATSEQAELEVNEPVPLPKRRPNRGQQPGSGGLAYADMDR